MVCRAFTLKATLELQFTSSRTNNRYCNHVLENSLLHSAGPYREMSLSNETRRFFTDCSIETGRNALLI